MKGSLFARHFVQQSIFFIGYGKLELMSLDICPHSASAATVIHTQVTRKSCYTLIIRFHITQCNGTIVGSETSLVTSPFLEIKEPRSTSLTKPSGKRLCIFF